MRTVGISQHCASVTWETAELLPLWSQQFSRGFGRSPSWCLSCSSLSGKTQTSVSFCLPLFADFTEKSCPSCWLVPGEVQVRWRASHCYRVLSACLLNNPCHLLSRLLLMCLFWASLLEHNFMVDEMRECAVLVAIRVLKKSYRVP